MTDQDFLNFVSKISVKANLPAFPIGKSEASLLDFYSSLSRLEKVQIHKLRHALQKRLSKFAQGKNDELDYISLIYAIADAKAYIKGEKKMNLRYLGVTNPADVPDFEKAKIQNAREMRYHKGARKTTQEALLTHRRLITLMLSEKCSTRRISAVLEQEYGIKIAHTTISRNLDLLKPENDDLPENPIDDLFR